MAHDSSDSVPLSSQLVEAWSARLTDGEAYHKFYSILDEFLNKADNPLSAFLDLVENSDVNNCTNTSTSSGEPSSDCHRRQRHHLQNDSSLTDLLWERFLLWQKNFVTDFHEYSEWRKYFEKYVTPEILFRATTVALSNDMRNFSVAASLFHLGEKRDDRVIILLSEKVTALVNEGNLKAVSLILDNTCSILSPSVLFNDETLKRLALFLICSNKSKTLQNLLTKADNAQRAKMVISHLDTMITLNQPEQIAKIRSELALDPHLPISTELFEASVSRLPRELGMDVLLFPNITLYDMKKKVGFLVRSTFGPDAEMDVTTFRELIEQFGALDSRFPPYAVTCLLKFRLPNEAIYFVQRFGLQHMFNIAPSSMASPSPSNNGDPVYQFPLPESAILVVDTIEKYEHAMGVLFSLPQFVYGNLFHKSVGVDAEWPGVLPPGRKQDISILQLALHDRVFIVDIDALAPMLTFHHWKMLVDFFESPAILKVGHGLKTDLAMLAKMLPEKLNKMGITSLADIESLSSQVWEAIKASQPTSSGGNGSGNFNIVPSTNDKSSKPPKSLANVAHWLLGRRIPKMFRMSNWSRRPLDRGQLLYAATDAYCLLEIFNTMCHIVTSHGLNVPLVQFSKKQ